MMQKQCKEKEKDRPIYLKNSVGNYWQLYLSMIQSSLFPHHTSK